VDCNEHHCPLYHPILFHDEHLLFEGLLFAGKLEELFMFKEAVPFYHHELFGFGGLFAHAGDID